ALPPPPPPPHPPPPPLLDALPTPPRGHPHRVAVPADADLVDHPPHLFETELAGEPACGLVQTLQMDREGRRRQQIPVDADGRHGHAVKRQACRSRNVDTCAADPARDERVAGFVEECDLAEFRKLQDVVFENAILLCW